MVGIKGKSGVYKRTKECKKILSLAHKKLWKEGKGNGFKEGHKINIGRHPTKETLLKMSKSQTGHKVSESQRKNISKTLTKGGHISKSSGYRIISTMGTKIKEHHLVWIRHNQMPVPKGFVIHHRDQDKLNNDIDNLVLLPHSIHTKLHNAYTKACVNYTNSQCSNRSELWLKQL